MLPSLSRECRLPVGVERVPFSSLMRPAPDGGGPCDPSRLESPRSWCFFDLKRNAMTMSQAVSPSYDARWDVNRRRWRLGCLRMDGRVFGVPSCHSGEPTSGGGREAAAANGDAGTGRSSGRQLQECKGRCMSRGDGRWSRGSRDRTAGEHLSRGGVVAAT
jgi:hypothetical protein